MTTVRIELAKESDCSLHRGTALIVENQFESGLTQKRIKVTPKDLGEIERGKPSSSAISDIIANGNIRFGVCNIGDTNRFEIIPARGAKLELKLGERLVDASYVVFNTCQTSETVEIIDHGEVLP
ncbi:MAG: hypothetical protein PHC51_13145 [bacterium]|nr:hypothetical protein [bacterium]